MSAPVCAACNDTHVYWSATAERELMCTRCPRPCEVCRRGADGIPGAYCNQTPCSCACHRPKSGTAVSADVPALLAEIRTLTESRDAMRAAIVESLVESLAAALEGAEWMKSLDNARCRALLRRIVAAFDADRAGHDLRCMPELVAAVADARGSL